MRKLITGTGLDLSHTLITFPCYNAGKEKVLAETTHNTRKPLLLLPLMLLLR
ncbi:hypothetical protein [Candidatus Venteria ishoeyi]|uniref:hypothetical protein n=1 Tax=Candidatus Venteria ishoeyi TaxID=1899563 RepID=UPI0015AD6355|nr:hypothetical protein [Candidatus Venteria ishoeyi]